MLLWGLLLAGVHLSGMVSSRGAVTSVDAARQVQAGEHLPLLTNALQVRQLAQPEAARSYPVRLRGVATFCHTGQNELFLQDGTGGVRVRVGNSLSFEAGVGQLLEVEGTTCTDVAVAGVRATRLGLIGEGPMPPLCRVTEAQLAAGEPYGCWVEVRGVVHVLQFGRADGLLGLELTARQTDLIVLIKDYNLEDCRRFVDAEVVITGVLCRTQTGQPELRVPFMGDISVIQPAPLDPFGVPTCEIDKIPDQSWVNGPLHRVKVEGLVTLQQPGRAVFIQSGTHNLMAFAEQKTSLQPDDLIELVGFPAKGPSSRLRLEHAIFRKLASRSRAVAVPIPAEEAATSAREAALVILEGLLLRRERAPAPALLLQSSNVVFRARLDNAIRDFSSHVREGSLLRLTGVCLPLDVGSDAQPTFELLLRSPTDVMVVKTAFLSSTWRRALLAAVAVLFAFLAAWRLFRRKAGRL